MTERTEVGSEGHPLRLPAFILSILLGAAGVIALVWAWMQFPDRADHPGFWLRNLGVTLAAGLLLLSAAWLLRRTQPPASPPTPPGERRPTWSWPLIAALMASHSLGQVWVHRGDAGSVLGFPFEVLFYSILGILSLVGTFFLARDFARRTEETEFDTHQGLWCFIVLSQCLGGLTSGGRPYLHAFLPSAAVVLGGVTIWLLWHRRPRTVAP